MKRPVADTRLATDSQAGSVPGLKTRAPGLALVGYLGVWTEIFRKRLGVRRLRLWR